MYNLGEQFARDYSLALANPECVLQGEKYHDNYRNRWSRIHRKQLRISYVKQISRLQNRMS